MINEATEMSKAEMRKFVQNIFDEEFKTEINKKKILTKEDIKDIVRDMFRAHYKTLWTKSNLFLTSM